MWADLSMKDKSDLMSLFLKQGISSLSDMRRIYDGTQDINNNYQVSLNEYSKQNNNKFTSEDLNIKPADINYRELALRQRYAESSFNNNAVSNKGAIGAYGIMPHIHKWYVEETGDTGDLTDLAYNTRIRDWLMERNLRSDIHSSADTDSVRVGKQLAQYNYGSGNTRILLKQLEDKGIDTHYSFEWLDAFPKETRDYINFTLREKDINEHKNTEAFNKAVGRKYKGTEDINDSNVLKPATITEKLGRRWDNFYWQKFKEPKDFSDEVANTNECAQWSNGQLRKNGYNIWGDAWTRSNQKVNKVFSGYDGLAKPNEYTYKGYKDYVLSAADNVKKNFNWRDLQENDIVGMYFRGSPNYQKAFINGTNGEAQTHTGHVVYRKGKPYVAHNVHGDIKLNKAKRILGRKHPYGIVSIYRPYAEGGFLL